jgi:hypothetical protein
MRAGINSGSGDPDPNDRDHETFFQMLPTVWLYAQFPFYNMMNNQDVFVQWLLTPHPKVNVRLDFHYAHTFGQDIINAQFDGKQGNYGYVEAIVSF